MKRKQSLWKRFCNCGYEEPIYQNYKEEITLQNKRMVRTTSLIGSIIMSLLTVVSLFLPDVSKVLPLYAFTAVMFIIICIVANKVADAKGMVTLVCNYAFLAAAFLFAIGLDIIQKSVTATTVCVLLVALPLLIVDVPWRESLYFLIIAACFMYESMYIKQSPKASVDILNACVFYVVGIFLGYKHNQMMLRNMKGQRLLEKQRDTDMLTSLYNKAAIQRKAEAYLKQYGAKASIFVMDMDNFKYVNDTYGHHAGDEILAAIGQLLTKLFRSSDIISRFGGDEFVIFLPEINDREILKKRAQQVLEGVKDIRISADKEYRAHVCMGIATCPEDGMEYEQLFRNADTAMYQVKKNGKNGFGFYDMTKKREILIVDDIELNRNVLMNTLETEYELLEAENGAQAMEIIQSHPGIDMVITDIQMPHMDGVELIGRIRQDKRFDNIAIIANTQFGDIQQEQEIFRLGVDDFLYKAVSPQVMITRVKNVLNSREKTSNSVNSFQNTLMLKNTSDIIKLIQQKRR